MKISCVIPAFNEGSTIIDVLKTVKKVKTIDEIIVVDDGSTDKTYKNAKSERVRVIKHNQNKGKGAAIKTGVAHSSGDIILFLDADLYSISPKKLHQFFNRSKMMKQTCDLQFTSLPLL